MGHEKFDGEEQIDVTQMYTEFLNFLNWFAEKQQEPIITVAEYGMIVYLVVSKMRIALTFPEMMAYLERMGTLAERQLQSQKEEGGNIFLAEEWRDNPEGEEMMIELMSGLDDDYIPEEWINEEE